MSSGQGSVLRIQDRDLGNRELSPISVRRDRGAGRKWDVKKDRVGGGAVGRKAGEQDKSKRGGRGPTPAPAWWCGQGSPFVSP